MVRWFGALVGLWVWGGRCPQTVPQKETSNTMAGWVAFCSAVQRAWKPNVITFWGKCEKRGPLKMVAKMGKATGQKVDLVGSVELWFGRVFLKNWPQRKLQRFSWHPKGVKLLFTTKMWSKPKKRRSSPKRNSSEKRSVQGTLQMFWQLKAPGGHRSPGWLTSRRRSPKQTNNQKPR